MVELGVGFVPSKKIRVRHFDKDVYLTLGNGDKLYKDEGWLVTKRKEDNELLSEFFSIFTTIIFFTDPATSNKILILTKNKEKYDSLLKEMFPDYIFVSKVSPGIIIFVDSIIKYREEIETWKPYLIMGVFHPKMNIDFYDGILLRAIMGSKNRLLIKGVSYREWNKKNLEKIVNFHQLIVRENYLFWDPITGDQEMDYDTVVYRYVISEYLSKIGLPNGDLDNVDEMIHKQLS